MHYGMEQWTEFTRGAVTAEVLRAMRQHLESGCESCADLQRLCDKVQRIGGAEAALAPPEGIVRRVKAAFAMADRVAPVPSAIELLFDSLLQPAFAGTRSSVASARQILFKVGTIFVDFRVELEPNAQNATLIGQILDSALPGRPLTDVKVAVKTGHDSLAETLSSRTGEFQMSFPLRHDLQLTLKLPRLDPVAFPLTSLSAIGGRDGDS